MPFATHRTLLLACALVATRDAARLMRLQVHQASILRAALDVRTGDAVRCNNNRKEKERKSSKQNFTSHTFKADLGELQFLSFFRVFYYFLFLCLAISGSTFNGPLRAYPGQKIMWTLAGVACCPETVSTEISRMQTTAGNFIPSFGNVKWLLRRAAVNVCSGSRKQQQQIICLVRFA